MTRQRPLDQELDVSIDAEGGHVRVLGALPPHLNADFQWADIERVCWHDGGAWGSDVVYVVLRPDQRVVTVPTEARGGHAFFGELTRRELFPEAVWRTALGDTSGGTHCWPPYEDADDPRGFWERWRTSLALLVGGTLLFLYLVTA